MPDYNDPVNVLRASEDFLSAGPDGEQLVLTVLMDEFSRCDRDGKRRRGDEWFAWMATVDHDRQGLLFWVGLSTNAPASILNSVEAIIKAMGFATSRTRAVPSETTLKPVLYLGDDGIERL